MAPYFVEVIDLTDEEFKEVSKLLKLSGNDEPIKKAAEDYIENSKAVLGFCAEKKTEEEFSLMRPDTVKESVPRGEILKNSKGENGEYFCLPERGEIF